MQAENVDPRFRAAEAEHTRLKQALAAGQITVEQCEKALQALTIEHGGRHWTLGANSGKWYYFDGQSWREALPPLIQSRPTPTPNVATPPTPAQQPYAPAQQPYAPAQAPFFAPPITPPAKTPLHKYILGCGLGCASPLAILAGIIVIVRNVMDGAYRPSEIGMTLVAVGVFLAAICLVALLRTFPLAVFFILAAVWTVVAFLIMKTGFSLGPHTWYVPDMLFSTGIVSFVGVLVGAGVRKLVQPKI